MWTFGDSADCDVILAKQANHIGYYFAVLHKGGKWFVKDLSNMPLKFSPMIRITKGNAGRVYVGAIINFSCSIAYHVTGLGENLNMTFLGELAESTTPYDKENQEIEMGEGTSIGRLKKNDIVLTHSNMSGEHCLVTPTEISDKSSFGSFVHLKNFDEYSSGTQSGFVEIPANCHIGTFPYNFEIK